MATPATPPLSEQVPPVPAQAQPDPAVARMQQQLNAQAQEINRMRSLVMAPPQASQPSGAPDKKELEREFIKNPLDMSAAIAGRVVQEALRQHGAQGFDTQVQMARRLARDENPELFDKWSAEIDAKVMQVDPQLRMNTTVWTNAFRMTKGEHVDELLEAARNAPPENRAPAVHIRQGAGPAAPTKSAPAPATEKITDEEKRVARKFRMTESDYLQGKKDNLNQTDIIINPIGPSSWDNHVTFDSREARRRAKEKANGKK